MTYNLKNIKEWEQTWFNCFRVSLGNLKAYKRRLKQLEKEPISEERTGKILALKTLIEYPELT